MRITLHVKINGTGKFQNQYENLLQISTYRVNQTIAYLERRHERMSYEVGEYSNDDQGHGNIIQTFFLLKYENKRKMLIIERSETDSSLNNVLKH